MQRSAQRTLISIALIGAFVALIGLPAASGDPAPTSNKISFGFEKTSGWDRDSGRLFNGTDGWVSEDGQPRQCGTRDVHSNMVLDNFCHATTRYTLKDGVWHPNESPAAWKIRVPNGTYRVSVTVGEAAFHSRRIAHSAQVEDVSFHDRVATTKVNPFRTTSKDVVVTDGMLDMTFRGGTNTKIVSIIYEMIAEAGGGNSPSSSTATTAASTTSTTAATTTTTAATTTTTAATTTTSTTTSTTTTTTAPSTTAAPTTSEKVAPATIPAGSLWYSFGNSAPPAPWKQANGAKYNGTAGWSVADGTTRQCGTRGVNADPVLDTFCHATTRYTQNGGTWTAVASPASWKVKVPNGVYDVEVTVGEAKSHPSAVAHSVQADDVPIFDRVSTTPATPFRTKMVTVAVSDGMLDLTFIGGTRTKIVSVKITPSSKTPQKAVVTTAPATTKAPTTTKKPAATTSTTKKPASTTSTTKKPSTTLPPVTGGTGEQITLFDAKNIVQDFDQYAQPNANWPKSGSMKGPVNYADGRAYFRLEILSKPTSINMAAQVCLWFQYDGRSFGNKYEETCSSPSTLMQFTDEGLYYFEIRSPSTWWSQDGSNNKTGQFDWGKKPHVARIMFKDLKTGTLFFEKSCGSACWSGGDARDHTPVKFNAELIFVEKGKKFSPPSDWNKNPWS